MSKKSENQTLAQQPAPVPFFAHLLNRQGDPAGMIGPTDYCYDNPCPTKKYPSDGDEPTSALYDR